MKFENKPGGCRVCVVEVEGRKNLAPACATDVMEGMIVHTHSARVINARKTVVELILSDHPNDCLQCSKSGDCELQTLAQKLGIREIPFKGEQSTYKKDSTLSIERDMDKCIMCRRCETMCNKIQSVGALSAVNRGFDAVVSPAFEQALADSSCINCGQCVQVCPVGALTLVDNVADVMKAIFSAITLSCQFPCLGPCALEDTVIIINAATAARILKFFMIKCFNTIQLLLFQYLWPGGIRLCLRLLLTMPRHTGHDIPHQQILSCHRNRRGSLLLYRDPQ
jgi:NAD-dependent dihydropyrimidine dehydrogenase PreA subunit